jgi:hypothetical protein
MFGVGGLILAGLLLVMGLVLTSNANFAQRYTRAQLAQQKITFHPAATLSAEEKKQPCLVKYAGQALTTGAQAECYANHFIDRHLELIAGGKTYAELGALQVDLKAQIATAQAANSLKVAADLQKQLAQVTTQRDLLFQGETMRGLLLTSYGFSVFGVKGGQAADALYVVSGLLLLLSLAGLYHAYKTPGSQGFAVPESVPTGAQRVLVNA